MTLQHRRGPIALSGPDSANCTKLASPSFARYGCKAASEGKPALRYNMVGWGWWEPACATGPSSPRSGPDCSIGPRSGPDCTVGPRWGPDCAVGPRSGPDRAVGPRSGPIAPSGARLRCHSKLCFKKLQYSAKPAVRWVPGFREDSGRVWCCWGYRLSLFCLCKQI